MSLTSAQLYTIIGKIHSYVQSVSPRYRTTSFTPLSDIKLLNAGRGEPIEPALGCLGFFSFGYNGIYYENTLAIYDDGGVKEHVLSDFPQYISLFLENLLKGQSDKSSNEVLS